MSRSPAVDVALKWRRACSRRGLFDDRSWEPGAYSRLWDEVANEYTDDMLPPDDERARAVVKARALERMVGGWRRKLERSFLDGKDVESIGDPAWDDATVRNAVTTLHERALASLGNARTPTEAYARRARIALMRYVAWVVDQGFDQWPDLEELSKGPMKEATRAMLERAERKKTIGEAQARKITGLSSTQTFPPDDWICLVDIGILRLAYSELPEELRQCLQRVGRKTLDALVAAWAEKRPGRRKAINADGSKFTCLKVVLKTAKWPTPTPTGLKDEWRSLRNGGRRRRR